MKARVATSRKYSAQSSQPRKRSPRLHLHKPNGVISARVQAVGADHFGIVSVDCAKQRSQWMLCNFYGQVLLEPAPLEHTAAHFAVAVHRLRSAIEKHGLQDLVVAVERTGAYHEPPRRAFLKAGFEVRIVHPFATKQHRLPAHPGNKTDETDLTAIHRSTVNGFGLLEQPLDDQARALRLLVRHRRDLVEKSTALRCQIREHLHLTMPGYASLFTDLWTNSIALPVARHMGSPAAVLEAGATQLARLLKDEGLRFQQRTLDKVMIWARASEATAPDAEVRRRCLVELDDDRLAKSRQIQALERDLAGALVQTPYVLLLAIPGLNVVSAADLAGEMGPIAHYANANAITGRAGLFPSRYQSDEVDLPDGKLVRCANRRLRGALLRAADNLVCCNRYFIAQAALWRQAKVDERMIRVRVAKRFSRLAFCILASRQLLPHPCCQQRAYILDKLNKFHQQHATSMPQRLAELHAAITQLPPSAYADEARPWQEKLATTNTRAKRKPTLLGEILPAVLARLTAGRLQSESSEDSGAN